MKPLIQHNPIPANRFAIAIGLACSMMASAPILAQTSSTNQDEPESSSEQSARESAKDLEQVVVTGSTTPDRTAAFSLAPIDVIDSEDIMNTGQPDLTRALRTLLPAFSMPEADVRGTATANIRPARLRGMSPNQTLVLVNGKRFHTTAYTNTSGFSSGTSPADLSAIPMAAIERVEVLRDGASTIYGSDAIAGVINIILKGGAEGGHVQVSQGQWDGGQGDTSRAGGNIGLPLGDSGWVRVSANWMRQKTTTHAGPDLRYPDDPTYGEVTMTFGLPYVINRQFGINGEYAFNENATLYAFSLIAKREASQYGTFRSLSQYKDDFPGVVELYPEGYLPKHYNPMLDDHSTLGLRGNLGAWRYDVSVTSGGNHWKHFDSDTVNLSLGADSPTSFYTGTNTVRENLFNADFGREFDVSGMEGPLNMGVGVAYRQEKYEAKQGDWASYVGSGTGNKLSDAGKTSRNNRAAYIDLSADLTADLSAELSARHERYSDFGTNNIWSLKGRYQISPRFAVRGTMETGFRAPSIQQLGYRSTGTTFVNYEGELIPFTIGTFQPTDPVAQALGAKPLKPETSRSVGAGIVITPEWYGPNFTLDVYQVKIDNAIQWTANLVGDKVQAFLESQGIDYVAGARFYANLRNNRVRGADAVATWPISFDRSTLRLRAGYSYNETKLVSVNPYPEELQTIGLNPAVGTVAYLPNRRTKGFVSARWNVGNWSFHSHATRYGATHIRQENRKYDWDYSGRVLTDVSASYNWDNWRFTLGADNVFNTYPPYSDMNAYSLSGNIPYDNDVPYGYNGRHVYVSAGYSW